MVSRRGASASVVLWASLALGCRASPQPHTSTGSPAPAVSSPSRASPAAPAPAEPSPPKSAAALPSTPPPAAPNASAQPTVPLLLDKGPTSSHRLALQDSPSCKELGSCALTTQGTVVCWSSEVPIAKPLPLANITQLVAGDSFHCALDAKGEVFCWGEDDCRRVVEGAAPQEVGRDLGPVTRILAAGFTLCLVGKGSTQCRDFVHPQEPSRSVAREVDAVTNSCMLFRQGTLRCDLGSPREGWARIGPVVFPGVFRAVVEGGFNPGYYGPQHCAIDTVGGVACCKSLTDCRDRRFERKSFPHPAVELVGANTYVGARLRNGDVHGWTSTIQVADVPFAVDPSGRVVALSNTAEIAGGGDVLCARLEDGHVACIGGEYGAEQASLVQQAPP